MIGDIEFLNEIKKRLEDIKDLRISLGKNVEYSKTKIIKLINNFFYYIERQELDAKGLNNISNCNFDLLFFEYLQDDTKQQRIVYFLDYSLPEMLLEVNKEIEEKINSEEG